MKLVGFFLSSVWGVVLCQCLSLFCVSGANENTFFCLGYFAVGCSSTFVRASFLSELIFFFVLSEELCLKVVAVFA